ncbi:hypothetical protein NC652_024394 [Populus alba x Populus x berolinensis]|nr:hypothetical protein NC652_024394 [Populus alba x Populus x berolinensis]
MEENILELAGARPKIYVKDLLALGVENGTAELQTQKYRAEEEDAGEDYGGWKQSSV